MRGCLSLSENAWEVILEPLKRSPQYLAESMLARMFQPVLPFYICSSKKLSNQPWRYLCGKKLFGWRGQEQEKQPYSDTSSRSLSTNPTEAPLALLIGPTRTPNLFRQMCNIDRSVVKFLFPTRWAPLLVSSFISPLSLLLPCALSAK